jgi:putative ABC transport system permease protein
MTLILPKSENDSPTVRPSRQGIWQALGDRTPLGWLQLKKSKSRLMVAVAGIGFADLLMFAQLGIQAALFDSNTMLNRGMDADIILESAQYRDLNLADTLPRRRLYQIKDIPGVQSAEPLYISRIVWKNPQTLRKTQLTLVGQSLDRPAFTFDEINQNLDKLKQPDTFLFDRLSRGTYADVVSKVAAGQSVKMEDGHLTNQPEPAVVAHSPHLD